MRKALEKAVVGYGKRNRKTVNRRSLFTAAAGLVVFITVYALILPAITMEHYYCGYVEHQHSVDCYSDGVLSCGLEEHLHTDACREEPVNDKDSVKTDSSLPETFTSSGPSVFGFGYSIDFGTVNGGAYSVLGGRGILLSEVLDDLSDDFATEDELTENDETSIAASVPYEIHDVTGLILDGEAVIDDSFTRGNVEITATEDGDYLLQIGADESGERTAGESRKLRLSVPGTINSFVCFRCQVHET